jgi:hypothetical protein
MNPISDHNKFSWAELFSDQNGKTSGTSFVGILICVVGTICFLLGCIDKMWISKSIDVITQSITFVLIGASLMGLKKVVGSKGQASGDDNTPDPAPATSNSTPQPVASTPAPAPDPVTAPADEEEPTPNPAALRDN